MKSGEKALDNEPRPQIEPRHISDDRRLQVLLGTGHGRLSRWRQALRFDKRLLKNRSADGLSCGFLANHEQASRLIYVFQQAAHAVKQTHLLRDRELVDRRVAIGLTGVEACRGEFGAIR